MNIKALLGAVAVVTAIAGFVVVAYKNNDTDNFKLLAKVNKAKPHLFKDMVVKINCGGLVLSRHDVDIYLMGQITEEKIIESLGQLQDISAAE